MIRFQGRPPALYKRTVSAKIKWELEKPIDKIRSPENKIKKKTNLMA